LKDVVEAEHISVEDDGESVSPALSDNIIFDLLTGEERKWTEREEIVQRTIRVLAEEYRFPLEQMARDVSIQTEVNGRRRRKAAELVVYRDVDTRELADVERLVVVRDPKTKTGDKTKGIDSLEQLLDAVESCEFGLWTNGRDVVYLRKRVGPLQNSFEELSDFPGAGESLDDLDRPDRRMARVAVAEDLRETVLRCHDYLYGNQSMRAERAFGELIKLIFCKIYDERILRADSGASRRFWVGVTERNNPEGQREITSRIKALFDAVKQDRDFRDAFRPGDEIELQPKALAWVAGELARYDFLSAEVDVKGMAYEAVVATTMKKERGQFFTPRNVVQAMVEILAPQPGEKVLDPACGSGRFLVACLERFRRLKAEKLSDATELELRRRRNSREVLAAGAGYARDCLYGIDVDPELVRAARMNMLINNDGHGNLVEANSLELTPAAITQGEVARADELGFGTFDIVLTNPPFGAKIPVDDPLVLGNFELAHGWERTEDGTWMPGALRSKMPPEILFIERCLDWLRDGGRMGIVLPDGILGNPDLESVRAWILRRARVLASIDLPVETFLPQVGVQASLVFLEKRPLQEVNAGLDPDYEIFMAVAEHVGHDRRGVPIYRRDPDGVEIWREEIEEMFVRRSGSDVLDRRSVRRRTLADDLPPIVGAYRHWIETARAEFLDGVGA
jgi:type I restriction enzyme M protein